MNLDRINSLIEEALSKPLKEDKGCKCGCNDCNKAVVLKESKITNLISDNLKYHVENKIPLHETDFRIGSDAHLSLIREARKLYSRDLIDVNESDKFILESNLGHFGEYKGDIVPLDLPMINETLSEDFYNQLKNFTEDLHEIIWSYKLDFSNPTFMISVKHIMNNWLPLLRQSDIDIKSYIEKSIMQALKMERINEAEYKGRDVDLNKPMRSSGPKKYKVYVKNDKGNVIQVNFGDVKGGLKSKINDPEARKAFADRHNCDQKKDKTKAGYWSCNLPRYAKLLGLGGNMNTYW